MGHLPEPWNYDGTAIFSLSGAVHLTVDRRCTGAAQELEEHFPQSIDPLAVFRRTR
jgi:hypothetical protein